MGWSRVAMAQLGTPQQQMESCGTDFSGADTLQAHGRVLSHHSAASTQSWVKAKEKCFVQSFTWLKTDRRKWDNLLLGFCRAGSTSLSLPNTYHHFFLLDLGMQSLILWNCQWAAVLCSAPLSVLGSVGAASAPRAEQFHVLTVSTEKWGRVRWQELCWVVEDETSVRERLTSWGVIRVLIQRTTVISWSAFLYWLRCAEGKFPGRSLDFFFFLII